MIVGIIGRGIVSEGCYDLLDKSGIPYKLIDPASVKEVYANGDRREIYVVPLGRKDYLENEESTLADRYLPYLTILLSAASWIHGSPRILT
jgi:hypothetical protein